jgi:DNA-binding SARP family transcriptional activator/tetratricopeptide (TPR) repeat protein
MTVRFGVLGDVEARVGSRLVDLGPARQRCVLAALLVDANQSVPVDQLADRVWGQHPPQRSLETLYSYLSRLRGVLADTGGVQLTRRSGGYVLVVDANAVDVHRFRRLATRAHAADREQQTLTFLRDALDLWRGAAFGTLDTPWINAARDALNAERFAAERDLADLRLRLGEHSALLGDLTTQAHRHPLDERLAAQLMLALYRSGRTADALEHYRNVHLQLAEDVGIDPGPTLQELHRQILRADPALATPTSVATAAPTHGASTARTTKDRPAPRQLPASPALFAGRTRELESIGAAWRAATEAGVAAPIVAIDGAGGVGKTWLTLRWAHEHRSHFPDGQLYVNLRAFDPSDRAVAPAEALRSCLDAFGVSADQIPVGLDDRAALYRTLLSGWRGLIVLDNARDESQVRPLLPGSSGCLILVTSRNRLTSLAVTEGATRVGLDVLTSEEARNLLVRRLGPTRIAAEPVAVDEILTRCARLPLALAIVAARAAAEPDVALGRLAADLRAAAAGLDAFDGGDAASDVRTVFSWSYRTVAPAAARLFRLLGLHPGPDVTAPAAAGLAALPLEQAERLLAELTRANLLTSTVRGRYGSHDLMRAYAAERVRSIDSAADRRDALARLLDYYLHMARAATLLLDPHQSPVPMDPPVAGVVLDPPDTYDDALAWCDAERPILVAAVHQGAAEGHDTATWRLAVALNTYLHLRGRWDDLFATQQAGLECARRAGDLVGQGNCLRALGLVAARVGRLADAYDHTRDSLRIAEQIGDQLAQARTHLNLAGISERRGRHGDAIGHSLEALELYRAAGHQAGQARALNSVGWNYAEVDDYPQALAYCEKAIPLHQESGDRSGEANTWDSLGDIHNRRGDHQQAWRCYGNMLDICRAIGDRELTAISLTKIGDSAVACGDPRAAQRPWDQALAILTELGSDDVDGIREKLTALELDG